MANRIVIWGKFIAPYDPASVRTIGIAKALLSLDYTIAVFCRLSCEKNEEEIDGLEHYNRFLFDSIISAMRFCKERWGTVDLLMYNPNTIDLLLALIVRKKFRYRLILDLTEWYRMERPINVLNIGRKIVNEFKMRLLNNCADKIICCSSYLYNFYIRKKPLLIPFIDPLSFDATAPKDISYATHRTRIYMFAGNPGYKFFKEDVKTLIDIFISIGKAGYKCILDLYGFTVQQLVVVYGNNIINECSRAQIRIHGVVSRQEVTNALQEVDFFIMFRPNTKVSKAGFPTKIMEAVRYGVPIIANDVSGDIAKYLTEKQSFLSSGVDKNAFKNNIIRSLSMSDSELIDMKNMCKYNSSFCYQNYINSIKNFI
ncbi:hypothetical protein AGMMS49992_31440 [Clostridia bacterium]|nr:hypothetical protein AGMMS49992_31440 [Clostridia bacterium]